MSGAPRGYLSIKEPVTAEQTIKRSRFICLLCPVKTRKQIDKEIACVKKAHYGARHNCSAYILGADGDDRRCNDDGEPQGTGGLPIMEVLQKRHLTDILAVVTRYFGGVLLGVGGLKRAYGSTAALTLDSAQIVRYQPAKIYAFTVDYASYAKLEAIVRQFKGVFTVEFGEKASVFASVPVEAANEFLKRVTETFAGAVKATQAGHTYIERNLQERL